MAIYVLRRGLILFSPACPDKYKYILQSSNTEKNIGVKARADFYLPCLPRYVCECDNSLSLDPRVGNMDILWFIRVYYDDEKCINVGVIFLTLRYKCKGGQF